MRRSLASNLPPEVLERIFSAAPPENESQQPLLSDKQRVGTAQALKSTPRSVRALLTVPTRSPPPPLLATSPDLVPARPRSCAVSWCASRGNMLWMLATGRCGGWSWWLSSQMKCPKRRCGWRSCSPLCGT